MATLTLTVDPEMLERARKNALGRNKTVEELIAESLAELAEKPKDQMETVLALEQWAKEHPFSVDPTSYTRDELHERR